MELDNFYLEIFGIALVLAGVFLISRLARKGQRDRLETTIDIIKSATNVMSVELLLTCSLLTIIHVLLFIFFLSCLDAAWPWSICIRAWLW